MPKNSDLAPLKPGRIGMAAVYLAFAAVVVRTLGVDAIRPLLAGFLGLQLVFISLFTATLLFTLPRWLTHIYLVVQCVIVLSLLSLRPQFDFTVVLFILLSYQASLFFTGRTRWTWIAVLVCLSGGSLIFYLGLLEGLAKSLTNIAAEIVIPAYMVVNHEIEIAQKKSRELISELQTINQQLQSYNEGVEELAAIQERNRLARELHDSVSQLIFSISLTTRSTQLLLDKDPARVPEQLRQLQAMAGDALSHLRSLITQLRPP